MNRLVCLFAVVSLMNFACPLHAADGEPGKAVLVTGASSGIGFAITVYLAERGFQVYAGARKESDLARLDAMENVRSVRLDVTVQEDIDMALRFVQAQGRGLFGIVNNAGVASIGQLGTVPDGDVLWMHNVNVMGPLRVNRAFLPMLAESRGRTVIIGSLSGFVTGPSGGAYSMSKFAVEAYTDTLAAELADSGVSVGIVDPGAFRSRGREKAAMYLLTGSAEPDHPLSEEQQSILASVREANDRLKDPGEVAEAVAHFLSSDSPRLRYMVAPDEQSADLALRAALGRAVQLNADQAFELDRDELVALLDELLASESADRIRR